MIRLNVVSRINEDKNFFFDLIYAVFKLKHSGVEGVQLLFIGDVLSRAVYQDMRRLANLLEIPDQISFTRQSIRMSNLPESVKEGYFFNFTIADFTGFSGIESVSLGYKTIFYNPDKKLAERMTTWPSMCRDLASLVSLITAINENQLAADAAIRQDNLRMKALFYLSEEDKRFLRSVLLPGKGVSA